MASICLAYISVWTVHDDLMNEESDDDIPSAKVTPNPSNPASKPLSTTSPTASQFSTVLPIVRLLCTISLRAVSATFPLVEIRASSIIIVGFTVCGVHGGVWPAILSTSTSADASSSSTNSVAAAKAHHHNHPSVYCLGLCCPGTEGPA